LADPRFTFAYIEDQYRAILAAGYEVLTCAEFVAREAAGILAPLTVVNRIDIDGSVPRAERLGAIFARLGIKGSFFVRLHAREYNPFDFDNYRILRGLADAGHEIGYHSEIVDQAEIWGEDAAQCLVRDLAVMEAMLGRPVTGVASHGGLTGYNNLDFWRTRAAADFGLLYEAYEETGNFALFNRSLYVTDSEYVRWKCYRNGVRAADDNRSPAEHICDKPRLLYLLIHPDTYYDRHIYE
jgi:hypothetical protein